MGDMLVYVHLMQLSEYYMAAHSAVCNGAVALAAAKELGSLQAIGTMDE